MSHSFVHYIGGPRDGLRECRDDKLYALEFQAFEPMRPLIGANDGDHVECRIEKHVYHKRPAGRDEYGNEVFVAIYAPMLSRG